MSKSACHTMSVTADVDAQTSVRRFCTVIDTRGRWAVCGKSTGVISVPLSSVEAADLGPPVAKASLEIMPLVAGFLHRPVVTLQRYLKRRSGEFGTWNVG